MDRKHSTQQHPDQAARTTSMNCNKTRQKLALYAGGDLSPADYKAVTAHLNSCGFCRAEAESYGSQRTLLSELASDKQKTPVSPFFWQGIQKAILLEENKPKRHAQHHRTALVAAAAAVLIGLSVYLLITFTDILPSSGTLPAGGIVIEDKKQMIEEEMPIPPDIPLYDESDIAPAGNREDPTIEF